MPKSSVCISREPIKTHLFCGSWSHFLRSPAVTEKAATDHSRQHGWEKGCVAVNTILLRKDKIRPRKRARTTILMEARKQTSMADKRQLLLWNPPSPTSFVNCQVIAALTFAWANLRFIIMPLPVMRPTVSLTQVRCQMAGCSAKHKRYKTAELRDVSDVIKSVLKF